MSAPQTRKKSGALLAKSGHRGNETSIDIVKSKKRAHSASYCC